MSKPRRTPVGHVKLRDAAVRLGHSRRWINRKIALGELEAFQWAPNDVTVSITSIEQLENKARITMRVEA